MDELMKKAEFPKNKREVKKYAILLFLAHSEEGNEREENPKSTKPLFQAYMGSLINEETKREVGPLCLSQDLPPFSPCLRVCVCV